MSVTNTFARDLLSKNANGSRSKSKGISKEIPSDRKNSAETKRSSELTDLETFMLLNSSVGVFETVGITSYPTWEEYQKNREHYPPVEDFWESSSTVADDKAKSESRALDLKPVASEVFWEEATTISPTVCKSQKSEKRRDSKTAERVTCSVAVSDACAAQKISNVTDSEAIAPQALVVFSSNSKMHCTSSKDDTIFAKFLSPFPTEGFQEMQKLSKRCYFKVIESD